MYQKAHLFPLKGSLMTNVHTNEILENQIIGTLLFDNHHIPIFLEYQGDKLLFFHENKNILMGVITSMYDEFGSVNSINLIAELSSKGLLEQCGGTSSILAYTLDVLVTHNFEHYMHQLLELYYKREAIKNGKQLIAKIDGNEDVFDVIDDHISHMGELVDRGTKRQDKDTHTREIVELMEKRKLGTVKPYYTYIRELDAVTSGFAKQDLVLIAGRPSMGKTGLGLTIAENMARHNTPTAFFSMEMSATSIYDRLIGFNTGIDSKRLRTGQVSDYETNEIFMFLDQLKSVPLHVNDRGGLTVGEIKAILRDYISKYGIEIAYIDQLSHIKPVKSLDKKEREVAEISRSLKAMAKELDIPVVLLTQLNRGTETRASNRPMLSDLRDSGTLENDADTVILIYRPEYYGTATFEDGELSQGKAELNVAKGRNTGTGKVVVEYNTQLAQFKSRKYAEDPF